MSGSIVTLGTPPVRTRVSRPFLFLNMSMTADGKIATANREVASFGSRRDREHLYELRATADGVMCGARTVTDGEVTLGTGGPKYRQARLRGGRREYPVRVLVSGSGSLRPDAPVFQKRLSPVVVLSTRRARPKCLNALAEVVDEVIIAGDAELDFKAALEHLKRRWRVRRLLCEGGGELNAALFRDGLVDELHLTICPFIFGGRTAPTIADGQGVARLADAARLRLISRQQMGNELFCVFRRRRGTARAAVNACQSEV